MRWVVVTDDAWPRPGGVARWVHRVVAQLEAEGDHVALFARRRPGLPPSTHGVWSPSFGRWGYLALAAASAGARRRADAVMATTWQVAPPGHRGLVVCHGSDVTAPARHGARRARVLRRSRVVAVSDYLATQARALGASGVDVLPAPVVVAPRPRVPRGGPWVWAGRMVHGKGGERFLAWLAASGQAGAMVGDGPLREAWQRRAVALGVEVAFPGWVDGPTLRDTLRASAVCVLPGERRPDGGAEGLNLVAVEASALGVPVVVTDVGGQREAAGPGLVLPVALPPSDAAGRIAAWLAAEERGAQAWDWARRHHGAARTVAALRARV